MRILIAHGSKRGGTAGIADMLAEDLRTEGFDVEVADAASVDDVTSYDAVVIGGSLYANRWHPEARRLARRRSRQLQDRPVWLFSSGPLDDTAAGTEIPPVGHVRKAMTQTGAVGHMTFGGALAPDAKGFPAAAMAKDRAGDWRDPAHVARWAKLIAEELRTPQP